MSFRVIHCIFQDPITIRILDDLQLLVVSVNLRLSPFMHHLQDVSPLYQVRFVILQLPELIPVWSFTVMLFVHKVLNDSDPVLVVLHAVYPLLVGHHKFIELDP